MWHRGIETRLIDELIQRIQGFPMSSRIFFAKNNGAGVVKILIGANTIVKGGIVGETSVANAHPTWNQFL